MTRTVTGLFDRFDEAQRVVETLVNNGFSHEEIGVFAREGQSDQVREYSVGETGTTTTAEGAGAGAVGGTILGGTLGLLVGTGLLIIPGIGPVLAAGPLAAAIGSAAAAVGATALGAGVGAATGGLVGALVGAGLPEEHAEYYAEGVRRGGTLVTVTTDDSRANIAENLLRQHGAVNIDQRSAEWRASGWTGWDVNANDQYTTSQSQGDFARGMRDQPQSPTSPDYARGVHDRQSTDQGYYDQGTNAPSHIEGDWRESSKAGTATGTAAGAATGAAIGAAGGPAGAIIGGIAGAATGAAAGAAGDAAGEHAKDTGAVGTGDRSFGGFDRYDNDFRTHYRSTYSGSDPYDYYQPAYRYGFDMANDNRYMADSWDRVESSARSDWERAHPSTWDRVKDSIRYAWEKARGLR